MNYQLNVLYTIKGLTTLENLEECQLDNLSFFVDVAF